MTIQLKKTEPFAHGGNRLCFVHPLQQDRCIKVRRPEFTLEDLRRKKGFPKSLRPLSWFDDNIEEFNVMQGISKRIGETAFSVLSRCYGFEETDMGTGLCSELIRDGNGKISFSLMQYIWNHGYPTDLQAAVSRFADTWVKLAIPSRDLILHNIVVQCDAANNIQRLVVIDGLGSPGIIPFHWQPFFMQQGKAKRKIANLHQRIAEFLAVCKTGKLPNTFWMLKHDGTSADPVNDSSRKP